MKEEKHDHWMWRLLKHPLLIATFSSLLFGAVVAFVGIRWQHQYLVEDNILDNRAKIAEESISLLIQTKQNVWDQYELLIGIHEALAKGKRAAAEDMLNKLWNNNEENKALIIQSSGVMQRMKIYFNMDEDKDVLLLFHEAFKKCQNITDQVNNEKDITSITREKMNQNLEEISLVEDKIHEILAKRIYSSNLREN